MSSIRVAIVKYLGDDPQPGLVECRLIDLHGVEWVFVDKVAIFTDAPLHAGTAYPQPGSIRCVVRDRRVDARGNQVVTVDTTTPDDIEAIGGVSRFDVRLERLVE